MTPFGQQLQFLRSDRGYSQKRLAQAAGIPYRTLSAVETGRRRLLSPDELERVTHVLQLDEEELTSLHEAAQLSSYRASFPRDIPPATLRAAHELVRELRDLELDEVRQIRSIARCAASRREKKATRQEGRAMS